MNTSYDFITNPTHEETMKLICQTALDKGLDCVEFIPSRKSDSCYFYFYNGKKTEFIVHTHKKGTSYHVTDKKTKNTIPVERAIEKGLIYAVRISDHLPVYENYNLSVSITKETITIFEKLRIIYKQK